MPPLGPIRIVAIGGSVRPGNFTGKALALVAAQLRRVEGVEVDLIDPRSIDWPFPGLPGGGAALADFQRTVAESTAVVLATPEYHGGISSVLKLVIENLGFPSRLAGKPVALLGVAAGAIGAVQALAQLRAIVSHVGALALPGVVSVAGVQRVFDAEGRCLDAGVEKRLQGLADGLIEYIRGSICPRLTLEAMSRESRG